MPSSPKINSQTNITERPVQPGSSVSIVVEHLGKKFNREWIIRDLSYRFEPGNIFAVTGPNGSGKSTLLQILWGQSPPSSGTIKYSGSMGDIQPEDVYKHIAIATPYLDLVDEFTLAEQLHFHFRLKTPRMGMTETDVLEKIQLSHARNKYISNFSSGMKQRLKLGLAFFSQADIIFLDEPGTNLDQQAFNWYLDQLNALPPTVLTFIASNQTSEYPSNAQKIDIMRYK